MLFVCPTPIGNLEDVTLRVLAVLGRADVVVCEDTRHTRRLLARHGLSPPHLLSFHEHNETARLETVLDLLREGKRVALVSDAGMPGLSDPGFTLVRACAAEGLPVTVLPGPSAISTALVASGLPTDRFVFVGFLPRGAAKAVAALEGAGRVGGSVVAFESPRRLRATLAAVGERWPSRPLAVCRELTKLHEQVLRGTAAEVLGALAEPVRGEIVLVLGPEEAGAEAPGIAAEAPVGAAENLERVLAGLLRGGLGTKEAAALVARLTGRPVREVYAATLAAKRHLLE
ncbi:MAG: 16S rRNA (cytidine(1402)-2'-O)-methyltransferase [Actinobacteria bacterium]|nr:16S rRNA (cytidine(1402)-2'-O)-methyltransferase [Actinomycetota bacterium]